MKTAKRALVAAIIGIMIATGTKVYADPLTDQLRGQQQQLQQNRNTYNDIEDLIRKYQSDIQKMDEQINDILYQIDDTKLKITQTQQNIKDIEEIIEKCEADLVVQQGSLDRRIRVLYMNGGVSYLDVILKSQSFGDFISRIEMVSRIVQYDKGLVESLKIKRDEVKVKKQQLAEENNRLLAFHQENKDKLKSIESIKEEQTAKLAELRNSQNLYASRMSEYQEQVNQTMAQIQSMKESTKNQPGKNNPIISASRSGSQSISGEAIVAYATDFLGVPYVWGGNTPAGFDCSGFTRYVFARFGISLNRRASQQALQGVPVSRNNLLPGDLVYFGSPVYHVGIYVGNDCFIHAPSSGDVVRITPLRWMDYRGARRLR